MLTNEQRHPISEIEPGLFIGDYECSKDVSVLMHHNISAIVSLGNRHAPEWDRVGNRMLVAEADHLMVYLEDQPTQDVLCKLPDICDFIDAHLHPRPYTLKDVPASPSARHVAHGLEDWDASPYVQPSHVLVHCNLGISRSPTAVAAYLMRKHHQTRTQVLASMLRKRRVHPLQTFMEQLDLWEEVHYQPWEDKERKVPKEPYRKFLEARKAKADAIRRAKERFTQDDDTAGWSLSPEAARAMRNQGESSPAGLVFFAPPAR